MRVIQSKFTKTNPSFFQNGGARARRAGPGSAFADGLERVQNVFNWYIECWAVKEACQI